MITSRTGAAEGGIVSNQLNPKFLAILIFFLLATTLFNTLRANRVEQDTTTFRKETRRQLKMTRQALAEQRALNEQLLQEIAQLKAAQTAVPDEG